MAILTEADKQTYFPAVTQTGANLNGLLTLAQAISEGDYGAQRTLELQRFEEILPVKVDSSVFLSYAPVAEIVSVSMRGKYERWRRTFHTSWFTLTPGGYEFDAPLNRLNLLISQAIEVKVVYTAGFDFSLATPDTKSIKAIAGVIVDWAARRYYGQMDSYTYNPSVAGEAAQSWNYVRPGSIPPSDAVTAPQVCSAWVGGVMGRW